MAVAVTTRTYDSTLSGANTQGAQQNGSILLRACQHSVLCAQWVWGDRGERGRHVPVV
jgi:hypothetical protein